MKKIFLVLMVLLYISVGAQTKVYEIVNKGKGVISEITPDNLLLIRKDTIISVDASDLQSVLNNGGSAEKDLGESYINILDGVEHNRSFEVLTSDGFDSSNITSESYKVTLYNSRAGVGEAHISIDNGLIKLGQFGVDDTSTLIEITPPIASTYLNFPAPSIAGSYTLPISVNGNIADTSGNITVSGGGNLQDVINSGNYASGGETESDAGSYIKFLDYKNGNYRHYLFTMDHLDPDINSELSMGGGNISLASGNGINSALFGINSGLVNLTQTYGAGQTTINITQPTINSEIKFPAPSIAGSYTLPISVNGNVADVNGNITLSGSTPTLQAVLTAGSSATSVTDVLIQTQGNGSVAINNATGVVIAGQSKKVTISGDSGGVGISGGGGGITLNGSSSPNTPITLFTNSTGAVNLISPTNTIPFKFFAPSDIEFTAYGQDYVFKGSPANQPIVISSPYGLRLDPNSGIVQFPSSSVNHGGVFTANSYVKTGGTSSQFLMADGSVSNGAGLQDLQSVLTTGVIVNSTSSANNANIQLNYYNAAGLDTGYIKLQTTQDLSNWFSPYMEVSGNDSGLGIKKTKMYNDRLEFTNSITPSDSKILYYKDINSIGSIDTSGLVHKTGDESIDGIKSFGSDIKTDSNIEISGGGNIIFNTGVNTVTLNTTILTADRGIDLPNKSGTVALTSDLPLIGYVAPSSATDTGVKGEIRITETYIYYCIATNTWIRSIASTWVN